MTMSKFGSSLDYYKAKCKEYAKALADITEKMTDEDIKKYTGLDGEEFNRLDVTIGLASFDAYPERILEVIEKD